MLRQHRRVFSESRDHASILILLCASFSCLNFVEGALFIQNRASCLFCSAGQALPSLEEMSLEKSVSSPRSLLQDHVCAFLPSSSKNRLLGSPEDSSKITAPLKLHRPLNASSLFLILHALVYMHFREASSHDAFPGRG